MPFNEILVRERKARGWSQEELAEKVQVSRQAVSKWETGDAMPDLPKLLALADALGVSLDALCGREAVPPAEPARENEAPPAPKRRWLPPFLCGVLCGVLAAGLLAGGAWTLSRRDPAPSEAAAAESALPDTFTVTGESFSYQNGQVNYAFTPSIAGEAYTYQITFTNSAKQPQTFDAVYSGGVCCGSAKLPEYDTYSVTVLVSDGVSSRSKAIAINLNAGEGHSSWTPVE